MAAIGSEIGTLVPPSPEKAPEIDTTFAIPELLVRHLPEKYRNLPETFRIMGTKVLGLATNVRVYAYENATLAAKRWAGLTLALACDDRAVIATAGSGVYTGPVMVLKEPKAEKVFIGEDKENRQVSSRHQISADLESAGRFSRVTGFRVRYCFSDGFILPPYAHEEGVLNFFIDGRAPGNHARFSQPVSKLFGCNVWSDGETRNVYGPTAWRGRILACEGIPVFQVIGNNVYHLALILGSVSNDLDRMKIMEGLLSDLILALAEGCPEERHEATPETFEHDVRALAEKRSADIRSGFEKIRIDLRELERKLAEKMREHENQAICLRALERETADLADRTKADFEKIRGRPDVTAVRIDAEYGLLVETAPIVLERGGRRYDLGPFRIHVAPDGQVAVWSETPRHPKGHHHPHIDVTSLECFGNITLAVLKLTMSYRLAETVELVMRWIRTYNPELTLIPLEEFPSEPIATEGASREKKKRKRSELLRAAQPARSEDDAAGDADRRRVDRKPRRLRAGQDGRAAAGRVGRR